VAVAPSGRAYVVWNFVDSSSAIHVATISRRGRLGPVIDLSAGTGGAGLGDVEMDAKGNLIVAWQSYGGSYSNAILTRRVGADGSLRPVHVVATGTWPNDVKFGSRLALDRAGNASVAWVFQSVRPPDTFLTTIESRRIDRNGNLSPLTDISAPVSDISSFRLTVDPAGSQTFAWMRYIPPYRDPSYALQVRTIGRDGQLGPIETLSSGSCGNCNVSAPKLISDAAGVVTAVWLEPQPSFRAGIKLSRFVPG
jgi:hypothetical protein